MKTNLSKPAGDLLYFVTLPVGWADMQTECTTVQRISQKYLGNKMEISEPEIILDLSTLSDPLRPLIEWYALNLINYIDFYIPWTEQVCRNVDKLE